MIRILVDSSSDYTLEEIHQKNIDLVPISITIGDKIYRDGIDLGRDEFYEVLASTKEFPKTAQPSPQSFLDIFREVKENGDEIICILLSSGLSGTYQSAVLARNMADYDGIYLIDSLAATYNIKVMADYAIRLRAEGFAAGEIAEKVNVFKTMVKVVAALDTLEYLGRGGRISKAAAAIGDIANIKPIITLTEEGTIGVLGKCLGKNKAIHALLDFLQKHPVDPEFPIYCIYSYGNTNCCRMQEKLEKAGFSITDQLQIGSTIGTHIGPEALGIVFVCAA